MLSNQFKEQLTTVQNVKTATRMVSMHVDDERIITCILESQELDIKNALGDDLYINLLQYVNRSNLDEKKDVYEDLLNGAIYEVDGQSRIFSGLINALNYFAYARLVKYGSGSASRIGYVNNQSEYSQLADIKQRQEEYKDAFAVAEGFMNDCIRYINYKINQNNNCGNGHKIRPRRGPIITKIGD